MDDQPALLEQGFTDLRNGLLDTLGEANLHLPPQYRMVLIPPPSGAPADFSALATARRSGPVLALPLLRRAAGLLKVIKQPEAAARRLARLIERMRKRRDARPYSLPIAGRHRLRPEPALLAGAIRLQVNSALADWPVQVRPFSDPDTS